MKEFQASKTKYERLIIITAVFEHVTTFEFYKEATKLGAGPRARLVVAIRNKAVELKDDPRWNSDLSDRVLRACDKLPE